jgi:tetratricopeptide (TPR) repeat protein
MVRLEWLRTAVGPGKGLVLGRPGSDPCSRAVALARTGPERIPPQHWLRVRRLCLEARDAGMARQWVGKMAPLGTALTSWDRILLIPEDPLSPVAGTLEELAPFSLLTVQYLLPARDKASYEELKAAYGPLADYDLRAMDQVAQARRDDPAAFRALYEKIARIEPGKYIELGDYLVDMGLEEEAAAAYESAVEEARDRVAVTRSVRWLVGYYLDRSHTHRARELAEQAAGVGSDSGLRVMGYFQERMGRYTEAEKWYRKLIERYGQNGRAALDAFYIRYQMRVGDGRFAGEAAEALANVFPAGLERVSIKDLTMPPSAGEGVRVSGKYQRTTRFGLLKGDVVVGLNGYRVHDDTQYALLWTLDDRPEATAIAWRKDRYVEVEGRLKTLHYGVVAGVPPGSGKPTKP